MATLKELHAPTRAARWTSPDVSPPASGTAASFDTDAGHAAVLHLAESARRIRDALPLPATLTDDALLTSLAAISAPSDRRERWRVAFGSDLGRELADAGSDLHTALSTVLSLLPKPRD